MMCGMSQVNFSHVRLLRFAGLFTYLCVGTPLLTHWATDRLNLLHRSDLALLLWAGSASGLAWFALRELAAASRRFDDFVRELARFNERCEHEGQSLRRRR